MRIVRTLGITLLLCLTFWPLVASAQPPQPQGPLVFQDDFSGKEMSGLEDNINATDFSRGFHPPGVYHLRLLRNNDTAWVVLPDQAYSNFTYELELQDNSDDFAGSAAGGAIFRAIDQDSFYSVLINPRTGMYSVRKHDGGTVTDLVPEAASELINRQGELNQLRIDGAGTSFTIYLNGSQLATFNDGSFERGGLGMIASNNDAVNPHTHFDNVRIYAPESNFMSLPGTGGAEQNWLPLLVVAATLAAAGLWLRRPRRSA